MKRRNGLDRSSIEASQESAQPAHVVSREELTTVHHLASELVKALEEVEDGDLISEIINNSLKLLRDRTNRGDIKLIDKSLAELRYALKIFAPYREVRKVSIFGSARTPETHSDYVQAAEFGRKMAEANWMVITGAGGGIMAAGHGGAVPSLLLDWPFACPSSRPPIRLSPTIKSSSASVTFSRES